MKVLVSDIWALIDEKGRFVGSEIYWSEEDAEQEQYKKRVWSQTLTEVKKVKIVEEE